MHYESSWCVIAFTKDPLKNKFEGIEELLLVNGRTKRNFLKA